MNDTLSRQAQIGPLKNKDKNHFIEKLKFLYTDSEEELLMLFCFWQPCSRLKSSFQSLLLLSLFFFPAKKDGYFKSHFRLDVKDLSSPKFFLTCLMLLFLFRKLGAVNVRKLLRTLTGKLFCFKWILPLKGALLEGKNWTDSIRITRDDYLR